MNKPDFVLDGIYPAAVTPFDADGNVDDERLGQLIEHFIGGGVAGVVIAGTTGEYYALREQERLALFARAQHHIAGRVSAIAGCNAGSTREVLHFAASSRELGYDAIMLSAPHTSLPTQSELAAHFETVARATGLPTILYNFPARAGVEIGVEALERLREVPEIVAVKEASGDFSRVLALRRLLGDDIAISCGSDDQAYAYFTWGVSSWIAGTANVLPREHGDVLAAVQRGDLVTARALHTALLPWIQAMESGRYNQKAKLGLRLMGVEVGDVRAPLQPLSREEAEAYEHVLLAARDAARAVTAGEATPA
jgi:4-hydroxy-tetrahydrodipicolinate synthase